MFSFCLYTSLFHAVINIVLFHAVINSVFGALSDVFAFLFCSVVLFDEHICISSCLLF